MGMALSALVVLLFNQTIVADEQTDYGQFIPSFPVQEAGQKYTKGTIQTQQDDLPALARNLYQKMTDKDDIYILFFESYGGKNKGFYVERNPPKEAKHLIFHADEQEKGITAVYTLKDEFEDIESIVLKKYDQGQLIKTINLPLDDVDGRIIYGRMLKSSVRYIDEAEIIKDPVGFNVGKYNKFVKDQEFVSALDHLAGKIIGVNSE